jgi:hypothetical protein
MRRGLPVDLLSLIVIFTRELSKMDVCTERLGFPVRRDSDSKVHLDYQLGTWPFLENAVVTPD